jgi:hypothetical protein
MRENNIDIDTIKRTVRNTIEKNTMRNEIRAVCETITLKKLLIPDK